MKIPLIACSAVLLLSATSALAADSTARVMNVRGQLRPSEYTSLAAGVAKIVLDSPLKAGSSFKKGDVLVHFDCREESAEKEIIEAKLATAKSQLDVYSKLDALENVSKMELEVGRAQVIINTGELKKVDAMLDKCDIRAPFAGNVTEKMVQPFQFATLGEPLLRIVNPKSLEVEAILPSSALAWIKKGASFTLKLDETGEVVTAVVDRLVGEVDPVSQTLRIFGRLQSDSPSLLPGMSGNLDFGAH